MDPGAWTPVAKDLTVDDPETGHSEEAAKVAAALTAAGIDVHQRAYVLQDDMSMGRSGLRLLGPGPAATDRIRVAVLVQHRDLERARQLIPADVTKPGGPANKE